MLRDVEQRVNTLLADDLEVSAEIMTQEQARAAGAMALFGEKYGDAVRVVSVGDWARELCGGTHVERSGQLGVVTLLGEASIGAGVRRVEALVGVDAYAHLAREHVLLASVTDALKVRPDEVPERVEQIVTRLREAEKELQRLQGEKVLQAAPTLASQAEDLAGTRLVAAHVGEVGGDDVRALVLDVRQRLGATSAVVALTALSRGRPLVVVATNEAAREAGVAAGALVKVAAGVLGGGGGGKADLAQGGGTDPTAVEQALAAVRREVSGTVGA